MKEYGYLSLQWWKEKHVPIGQDTMTTSRVVDPPGVAIRQLLSFLTSLGQADSLDTGTVDEDAPGPFAGELQNEDINKTVHGRNRMRTCLEYVHRSNDGRIAG